MCACLWVESKFSHNPRTHTVCLNDHSSLCRLSLSLSLSLFLYALASSPVQVPPGQSVPSCFAMRACVCVFTFLFYEGVELGDWDRFIIWRLASGIVRAAAADRITHTHVDTRLKTKRRAAHARSDFPSCGERSLLVPMVSSDSEDAEIFITHTH